MTKPSSLENKEPVRGIYDLPSLAYAGIWFGQYYVIKKMAEKGGEYGFAHEVYVVEDK